MFNLWVSTRALQRGNSLYTLSEQWLMHCLGLGLHQVLSHRLAWQLRLLICINFSSVCPVAWSFSGLKWRLAIRLPVSKDTQRLRLLREIPLVWQPLGKPNSIKSVNQLLTYFSFLQNKEWLALRRALNHVYFLLRAIRFARSWSWSRSLPLVLTFLRDIFLPVLLLLFFHIKIFVIYYSQINTYSLSK